MGLALACAACGAGPPRVALARADQLGAIRVEGNRAIASDAIVPALALVEAVRDGAAIDPYLVTVDADRIRAAYLRRGFFAVQVTARIEPGDRRGQIVVYTVVEGRRAAAEVELTGVPPELAASAAALIGLRSGAPFDYDAYATAKQPLHRLLEDAGYAHVEVVATVHGDPSAGVAHVRYAIASGPRCTFGKISFTGSPRASLIEAAAARLGFATGAAYSATALEAAQTEIYEIGRFSAVQVRPDLAGGATIDVAIELSEANRHEIHGGFGFGYEPLTYEPRVRGGFSVVPAALPLLTLAADARVAYTIPHDLDPDQLEPKIRGLISAQYLDLFRPRLRGQAELGVDFQTVEAYTWTGTHVRLGVASPLGTRWLQLRLGWVLEQLAFSAPNALVSAAAQHELRLDRDQRRGAYEASLVADLRDSAIDPHRGVYVNLPVVEGTPLAGGELTYLQLTPEVRGYLALGDTVIAARARAGAIVGEVPVTERYFSGGTTGQRGFSERRLSPVATAMGIVGTAPLAAAVDKVVVGGAGLFETGVELRRPLGTLWTFPVGGNLFLDGGDVTRTPSELAPSNLHWAIGSGVWTRLGGLSGLKIRVDVGYRLNRQSPDTDALANIALHLGVGEAY